MEIILNSMRDGVNFISKIGSQAKASLFFDFMSLNSQDNFMDAVNYIDDVQGMVEFKVVIKEINKGNFFSSTSLIIPFESGLTSARIEVNSDMGDTVFNFLDEQFQAVLSDMGTEKSTEIINKFIQTKSDKDALSCLVE